MIDINTYIDTICDDFCEYLNANVCLCELKKMHYDAGKVPNYTNIHNQQLYLLRYAYAYAFEYKYMYSHLLKSFPTKDTLEVMSIGCGNMIDYWSLTQSINPETSIIYKGYDSVDWAYKFSKRDCDKCQLVLGDALDSIEALDYFSADIIVFPKSISEFSLDSIDRICACIKDKGILKDNISMLVSLRADQGSQERDMEKVKRLYNAIIAAGFTTDTDVSTVASFTFKSKKIRELDTSFSHPSKIVDLLPVLYTKCKKYIENGQCCENDCEERLNRWPMLSCRSLQWQFFEFTRR